MVDITEFGKSSLGGRLEITLFEGVEFDSGLSPAPTVDPQGFRRGEQTSSKPGGKVLGYLRRIEGDKLFLSPTDLDQEFPLRDYFVEAVLSR